MSKRRSTGFTRVTRSKPARCSTPSVHEDDDEDMALDGYETERQDGDFDELLDTLRAARQASLPPASPRPPPSREPSIPPDAQPVLRFSSSLLELNTARFLTGLLSDPLDSWSRLVDEVLILAFEAATDLPPEYTSPLATAALSRARSSLVDKVDRVDTLSKHLGVSLRRPCPASCKVSAPPPPPPVADKSVGTDPVATPALPPPARPGSQAPRPKPRGPAHTPDRSYAQAAQPSGPALPAPAAPAAPAAASLPRKPKAPAPAVPEPVRLVVRFGGQPPQDLRSGPQSELFRRVSNALDVHPTIKGVSILGAHWNKKNNVIVSFPAGTLEATVLGLRPTIRLALGVPESVELSIDKPWSKLMISSVPARAAPGAPVLTHQDLADSFVRNPAIRDIAITRQPRWIRNPDNITSNHSSFVFSFEDPDGSVVQRLRKTALFMFGSPVTVKRWEDKPRPPKPRRSQGAPKPPRAPAATAPTHTMEVE